jgi:hypothetical protein
MQLIFSLGLRCPRDQRLLQRDAPPSSVRGEPIEEKPGPNNIVLQIDVMAQQLVDACKQLDDLMQHIPDITLSEEQQLDVIVSLQQENDRLGDELRDMQKRAQNQLAKLHALFGVLADDALRRRAEASVQNGSV